jgi:hypothetical protein
MVIGEQGLAALALEKFAEVYEIEGGLHWHLGGILVPFFGPVFWVDFSPLFGLRAFGKLLVLRDLLELYGGFGPFFGPLLDRTFHHPRVHVLAGHVSSVSWSCV